MKTHESTNAILKFFAYEHLPERLHDVSMPFCKLAKEIATRTCGEQSTETDVALRKLLEAKDAAVRAAL